MTTHKMCEKRLFSQPTFVFPTLLFDAKGKGNHVVLHRGDELVLLPVLG